MTKRPTEIIGFIHEMSPKKAKSFRLKIQSQAKDFQRAICFDLDKHDALLLKQASGDPVKLRKIISQPQPSGSNFAELVINKSTIIDTIDPVKVAFERYAPEITFSKLDAKFTPGELVSICARLDLKHSVEKTVFVHPRNAKVVNNAFVFDSFGSCAITIWDEWIDYFRKELDAEKDYYQFTNLLVRDWNGEISLTTCSDTAVVVLDTNAPDIDLLFDNPEDTKKVVLLTEFDSVKDVLYLLICSSCGKKNKATKEQLLACMYCGATMRTEKLSQLVEIIVKCQASDNNHYIMNSIELAKYIDVDPCSFETDREELVSKIMNLANITVSLNDESSQVTIIKTSPSLKLQVSDKNEDEESKDAESDGFQKE